MESYDRIAAAVVKCVIHNFSQETLPGRSQYEFDVDYLADDDAIEQVCSKDRAAPRFLSTESQGLLSALGEELGGKTFRARCGRLSRARRYRCERLTQGPAFSYASMHRRSVAYS